MPPFIHCGLYFTADHIKSAIKDQEREPLKTAWQSLQPPADSAWVQALLNGFRWRFGGDEAAGAAAAEVLLAEIPPLSDPAAALLTQAQIAELVRDHAAIHPSRWNDWLQHFAAQIDSAQVVPAESIDEHLMRGLLAVASGIVLEDSQRFEGGVQIFREAITDEVRPAGYLESAVAVKDGGSFQRQFRATRALVLMAEAAASVGLDLWSYESRGISVNTAATYLIYYYYYPEKWKWEPLSAEVSKPLYQTEGGFLEMVYRRNRHKDMKLMLDELRPVFDLGGGGLTTLSHAVGIRRSLFG
jgi:hypothetical protein